MNSTRTEERTGGTSANVALGLCTTGVETNFVGYLGNDDNGKKLREVLDKSEIKHSIITEIDGPTSNALILIDDKAERTIISMTKPYLRELRMDNVPFSKGDVVANQIDQNKIILTGSKEHTNKYLSNLRCPHLRFCIQGQY